MAYVKAYFHIVWATHSRRAVISADLEPYLFSAVGKKCDDRHIKLFCVNCVEDHIHMAIDLHPSIALETFVSEVKGYSSYIFNRENKLKDTFRWQRSYGALGFGETALEYVQSYVDNQKLHHAQNTTVPYLENTGET